MELVAFRGLLILSTLLTTLNVQVSATRIDRELILDPDQKYHLQWTVDFVTKIINFTATVKTEGYVGLGVSRTPGMTGGDLVMGGVANGEKYFADYHSTRNGAPIQDVSQDWFLTSATEELGVTTVKFYRLLATCDEEDVEISESTQYLIWAIGTTDEIEYHGSERGSVTLNLLDPAPDKVDFSGFNVWNVTHQFQLPSRDTTYWCTVHKMPQTFDGINNHIVAFDIILNSNMDVAHMHHVIIRRCLPPQGVPSQEYFEEYINHPGDQCYIENTQMPTDHCESLIYAWAIGGGHLILPPDVGYAMGKSGESEYLIMEVHYDNPLEVSDVNTTGGVSIYYIDEKRPTNGAVIMVGSYPGHQQTIPPEMTDFVSPAHCGSVCTNSLLPPEGVNIFNVLLHSHLAGRKIKVRHFRDQEELPWITADDYYDFNYQAARPLREEVKLLPGDHVTIECTYDTSTRTGVTLGGNPSSDEMCETFMWVYPSDSFISCATLMELDPLLNMFGIEELNWTFLQDEDPYVAKPIEWSNRTYSQVLNSDPIGWTDERKRAVQEMRFGPHDQACYSFSALHSNSVKGFKQTHSVTYPEIDSEYEPINTCENSVIASRVHHLGLCIMFTSWLFIL